MSTSGGTASLDTDGDDLADNTATLTALGITDAELAQLAGLYPAGKTLWRSPITHFTPWDCNWPYGPPPDAVWPSGEPPKSDDSPDPEDSDDCQGCSIEAQSQTLGEEISITGTPLKLHYRSDRVPGRTSDKTLKIPLSGASVPGSLKKIILNINLAGRSFVQRFPPQANQTHTFTWDGKDAYGRRVAGRQTAKIRIGYTYQGIYNVPPRFARSFALLSRALVTTGDRARQEITLWRDSQVTVAGSIENTFARWSMSVQHLYDVAGGVLYTGDGGKRSAKNINATITTVAGNGLNGFNGDRGPAPAARLSYPRGVAIVPDGSLYIADSLNHRIRRVGTDGIITTIVGTGTSGFGGDGGPATAARIWAPEGIDFAPDGTLYIADDANERIRRVGSDGIITTVAGKPTSPVNRDGYPATEVKLNSPQDVALAPDGSFYFADTFDDHIQRVGLDGIITTTTTTTTTASNLNAPTRLLMASDGSLYVADSGNHRIRRVGPNGLVTTVAGTGQAGFSGDGGPAIQAKLSGPGGIAVAPDGTLYIADTSNNRIRRVEPNGIITTVAGTGAGG
ncbi:MAG: RHS repeat-associated core domain-containing protein, partial [Gammaproteobacteria bacterium]